MASWTRSAAMAVVLGGLSLSALSLNAQDKPKAKKDAPAAESKGSPAGAVEVGEGKDGKFRFFVRDGDGKLLAMSGPGGFETKADAFKAITELKAVLSTATVKDAPKKKVDDEMEKDEKKPKDKKGKDGGQ